MTKIESRDLLARNVRAAMTRAGVTQTRMASIVGMSIPALNRRLRGHIAFTADQLIELADGLCVPVASFFEPVPQLHPFEGGEVA